MNDKIKKYLEKNLIKYEENRTHGTHKDMIFIDAVSRNKVLKYLTKNKINIDWSYCGNYEYVSIIFN